MDEIEVEAVDSLDPGVEVDTAEYVLYGGKGGVGKTTMAAATALASASDGTNTLVVSTDPAHSLSDTLEAEIPSRPHRIREDVPLWAVEIDPDDALDQAGMFGQDGALSGGLNALLGGGGGMPGMGGGADAGPGATGAGATPDGDGDSAAMMPGADEAAAMQLLLQYLDDERFDRVVVDTAPTGHTLRLLELPEVMDSLVGRFMQFRERLGGMMDGLTGMFGGGGDDTADTDLTMDDLDAVKERVERLRAVLTDPQRTDFRVVLVPEELSVAESNRLVARLDEYGVPVNTVVVNRVMEPLADVTDVPADAFVAPNHEDCEFCARRWDVQQQALADAQDLFRGHTVKRVPLLAEEVRGERPLRVVASCLE